MSESDTPRYFAFNVLVYNPERTKLLNKHVLKNYTRVILVISNN